MNRIALSLLLPLVLVACAKPGNEAAGDYRTFTADIMSTLNQVVLPDVESAPEAAEAVFEAFREVDRRMSEWKETSPLSEVNRRAGDEEAVPVPADLIGVLRRGIEIGDATGGAFDLTWAALWGLWDFRAESPSVPDPAEIARRTALVDYRKLIVDPEAGTARLPEPGMKLGLGGIAKGYALDRAGEILDRRGFTSYMVLAGGQVFTRGDRGGRPWRIGIRDPRGAPDDYFAFLDVSDASVSTSGDYESFFVVDGVRYHHILDPRTGRPARGLRSATVMTPDATLADALSTAFMVLGREKAMETAKELGVDAVLVDAQGEVVTTGGIGERLTIRHPPARD